jgi:FAD/FMN-containing dehydrogenase
VRSAGGLLRPGNLPLGKTDDASDIPSAELLEDRVQQALALLREVRALWQGWLRVQPEPGKPTPHAVPQLQDHTLRASWKTQIRAPLQADLLGRGLRPDPGGMQGHPPARCCAGRVWVALHMHAGDGNVHTNIPVNSDNYEMLQTAHEAVARIMALARSLDGVISGEHGIGITKLEFLTDDRAGPLRRLQGPRRPRRPLQQGQAAARHAASRRLARMTTCAAPT